MSWLVCFTRIKILLQRKLGVLLTELVHISRESQFESSDYEYLVKNVLRAP